MSAPDETTPEILPQRENPLKPLLVFLLLVILIIGCFWVSFSLGRRLLSPSRSAEKIQVAIPEPPASIAHLQKLAAAVSLETAKKVKTTVKAPIMKPLIKSKSAVKVSKKLYKIQAGLFTKKADALALSEKLNGDGFETSVKKVGGSWRVQTGAFRNLSSAQKLQKSLTEKGYKSTVIVE